ncbi:PPE family protein PPE22 [Mycobacterium tuberculosis H37Rv] [Mycobacterium shimoidei]|uniref:PPE family protein PPE22 [Mycobacterium tuberculosis H37Rv] n=1 Tax=Mycobacterium shimoidei TaxID=29313 RepID=A0A375Z268_MYCSH|nr:PPE family protein PPE22 [Mycobacterium tuberculosis H37Rv] [Mycobacterium shimoidei]
MLDFGALPPEINSARMYAGPESAPMVAAASAWNSLAAELNSAALAYEKVITALSSEEWMGPASASMSNAAAPYVNWMTTTAVQAEQAANQARAAAAAYENAFAATVPPPLIAQNRAQLAQLVATNILGQNTPLIAALEAQYGQMWAEDAAAMYAYAGQSATAARVTPFAAPEQAVNPAGQAMQAAAVTQASATSAGTASQTLSETVASLPNALQSLATPAATTSVSDFLSDWAPLAGVIYNVEGLPYFTVGMSNNFVQMAKTFGLIGGSAPAAAGGAANAAPGLGNLGGLLGGGAGSPVSAALGGAGSVGGKLSVPPVWTPPTAAPTVPTPGSPLPISSVSAAPDAGAGAGSLLGGMPLAGAGAGAGHAAGPRYGFRPTVMTRPPFAG